MAELPEHSRQDTACSWMQEPLATATTFPIICRDSAPGEAGAGPGMGRCWGGAPRCHPPSAPREFSAQGWGWKSEGCLRAEGGLAPCPPLWGKSRLGSRDGSGSSPASVPGARCSWQPSQPPSSHSRLLPAWTLLLPLQGCSSSPCQAARDPTAPVPCMGTNWPAGIFAWILDRCLELLGLAWPIPGKTPWIHRARGWDGIV